MPVTVLTGQSWCSRYIETSITYPVVGILAYKSNDPKSVGILGPHAINVLSIVLYSIVISGPMVFKLSFRSDSWPLDENAAVLLPVTTYY